MVDLDGRWLLPGLWDEHVHLDQWALVRRRLDVAGPRAPPRRPPSCASGCWPSGDHGDHDDDRARGVRLPRRAVAGRPSPGLLDGAAEAAGQRGRPVVLVSGDLHCAWLSTAAAQQLAAPLGVVPDELGLVREAAAFALSRSLGAATGGTEAVDAAVAEALADAAARGVVGVVDLEMTDVEGGAPAVWRRRAAAGRAPALRVEAGVYPDQLDAHLQALADGRTGGSAAGWPGSGTTYAKVITDGSLNTRTACCTDAYPGTGGQGRHGELTVPPQVLLPLLRRAVAGGLVPAVHAIGDAAVGHALDVVAALRAQGYRGPARVEHAQLVADDDVARFAALDVTASVQPAHLLDDRDVAETHWAGRTRRAFPLRALLDAGARLALGSDAPVAPLDPWLAMEAAVHRGGGGDRPAWHPEQAVTAAEALVASTRGRAAVEVGGPADVIAVAEGGRSSDLTVVGGRVVHRTLA